MENPPVPSRACPRAWTALLELENRTNFLVAGRRTVKQHRHGYRAHQSFTPAKAHFAAQGDIRFAVAIAA
jgi:hypothetical protein